MQLFPCDPKSASLEREHAAKVIQDWWVVARFQIYQAMYDEYAYCQDGKIVGNPPLTYVS